MVWYGMVCMYVCMYVSNVCMYVCGYVCRYVHTYVRMYACMHACMHVCTCMCVNAELTNPSGAKGSWRFAELAQPCLSQKSHPHQKHGPGGKDGLRQSETHWKRKFQSCAQNWSMLETYKAPSSHHYLEFKRCSMTLCFTQFPQELSSKRWFIQQPNLWRASRRCRNLRQLCQALKKRFCRWSWASDAA